MSRYIAVETDFVGEWIVVDTQYPRGRKPNSKETVYSAKVVQQGLREDFAKTLVKSLNQEG